MHLTNSAMTAKRSLTPAQRGLLLSISDAQNNDAYRWVSVVKSKRRSAAALARKGLIQLTDVEAQLTLVGVATVAIIPRKRLDSVKMLAVLKTRRNAQRKVLIARLYAKSTATMVNGYFICLPEEPEKLFSRLTWAIKGLERRIAARKGVS